MQHALEDHHAKWLVPAWHYKNIRLPIPLGHFVWREPASELNLTAIRPQEFMQPFAFNVGGCAISSGEYESHPRKMVQNARDCLKELVYSLAIYETAGVKDHR